MHVLRGEATDGTLITYDIECVTPGGFFGNPATVSLASGSAFEDLLGTGFTSIGNHPDVDCAVTVTLD
ncbi:MAG TPA: hypothetical protein PKA98_05615 [Acidimicrobiales bacterium]|mgnify:CR=1 FL=1|nr:hypothetical protein [Acidimicrobiales bacterium]